MSRVCAQSGVGVKGEDGPMAALPTRDERARRIELDGGGLRR